MRELVSAHSCKTVQLADLLLWSNVTGNNVCVCVCVCVCVRKDFPLCHGSKESPVFRYSSAIAEVAKLTTLSMFGTCIMYDWKQKNVHIFTAPSKRSLRRVTADFRNYTLQNYFR
jgi:hypothetical protein